MATSQDGTYDIDVSADRLAITMRFSNIKASVGDATPDPSDQPKFALTLPLTDGAQNAAVTFSPSGYAFVSKGATARLILSVNGHTAVKTFSAGWDNEFTLPLRLPAIPASECQLSLTLEVDQAPGSADGVAQLNVSSLDAQIK